MSADVRKHLEVSEQFLFFDPVVSIEHELDEDQFQYDDSAEYVDNFILEGGLRVFDKNNYTGFVRYSAANGIIVTGCRPFTKTAPFFGDDGGLVVPLKRIGGGMYYLVINKTGMYSPLDGEIAVT
jgi:hypothetical protein